MKVQTNLQSKSAKKLSLNKESIRVLTQLRSEGAEPTNDCTIWTC